jgi:hypothetical protein
VRQPKKLTRAERVRLASEKFGLAPYVVETALANIAAGLHSQKKRRDLFGNKEERKQVEVLRHAVHRTLAIAGNAGLPPTVRDMFTQHDLEFLNGLRIACDFILRRKLKPKRDDADGYEKRLAALAALYLLPPTVGETQWQELTAILSGAGNTATFRRSFRTLLPNLMVQKGRNWQKSPRMMKQNSLRLHLKRS